LTTEQKQKLWDAIPPHMRDARTKGIPVLGSGRIFPIAEEEIRCKAFPIPPSWPQIVGVDFGYDHPFGAVRCAWDRDNDIWYVVACYRRREATPVLHAAAIKPWGDWIPVAWPHDGLQHDKGSGLALAEQYRSQGLEMLSEHATHEEGGNGLEAGVLEMLDRMQTGRFRVFAQHDEWFEEFRLYHREDGRIVKLRDDLLSATRYALMMRRHAIVEPRKSAWKAPDSRWVV
jgi:hypothetical protein